MGKSVITPINPRHDKSPHMQPTNQAQSQQQQQSNYNYQTMQTPVLRPNEYRRDSIGLIPQRPRGDSIYLPPPIDSLNNPVGGSFSRSNSIFSSLINLPSSQGNSVSEPSKATLGSTSRPRQLSIVPGEQISYEDLENLISRESLGNLLQQNQNNPQNQSKVGSIDFSSWNEFNNNNSISNPHANPHQGSLGSINYPGGSISYFNGSLGEIIAGMINNGSIDLSNMSQEQRRDSILKILNDSQLARRTSVDESAPNSRLSLNSSNQSIKTELREDIFDRKGSQDGHNALQDSSKTITQSQHLQEPHSKVDKLSPTSSSRSKDEPQSPKTSPTSFTGNSGLDTNPQQLPPPSIPLQPPQRLFQNYTSPPYANYQHLNSLPPSATVNRPIVQQMNPIQLQQDSQALQRQQPLNMLPQQQQFAPGQYGLNYQPFQDNANNRPRQNSYDYNDPTMSLEAKKKPMIHEQVQPKADDGRPLLGATKIDQLMLVIQARDKGVTEQIPQASDGSIIGTSELKEKIQEAPGANTISQDVVKTKKEDYDDDDERSHKRKKGKLQQCPYCLKYFTQSTHLEVHIRSHIGYKPYECNYCHKKFTQGGNLRTHLRLHTGEKPFTCDICNRSFSRKGNLGAHKLTHENLKPFVCRLDGCDKSFTQLGNLKSHQNRFHLATLNDLTHRLAELNGDALQKLPPHEKELLDYFKGLYKNSNKGIKGRGKTKMTTAESPTQPISQQVDQVQYNLQQSDKMPGSLPRQHVESQPGMHVYGQHVQQPASQQQMDYMAFREPTVGGVNGYKQ